MILFYFYSSHLSLPTAVSDLTTTARLLRSQHHKPFRSSQPNQSTTNLFLPSTRPPCVDMLYGTACESPVPLMCTIDRYRTDGMSASDLFMVTPVLGGQGRKRGRRILDIETRKPANFSLANLNQDRIEYGSASLPPLVSPSRGFSSKQNETLELERLPSPEEQAMLVSLEYPSTIVPVDTSGRSFSRMSLMRRSLIHADFYDKLRKSKRSKKRSKQRRHTFCEGQNRDLDQAIRQVADTSCQTEAECPEFESGSGLSRMSVRRRSRSVQDNSRRIIDLEDTEEDKEVTPIKTAASTTKKSSLRSLAQGLNSSLSAAISAVRLRGASSSRNKHEDGRSSSGNWSATSSVDSSAEHMTTAVGSPSRSSVGKDSLLSSDVNDRSRDDILPIQMLTSSPVKKKKFAHMGLPWETSNRNRTSKSPTPESAIRSPYAGRRGVSDDGDSSVYSVDTDGYYTSMHTDSGLWSNLKSEDVLADLAAFRQRKESQSSVETNDSSINSFLSKSATECSSNSDSFKLSSGPKPPERVSSCKLDRTLTRNTDADAGIRSDGDADCSVRSDANFSVRSDVESSVMSDANYSVRSDVDADFSIRSDANFSVSSDVTVQDLDDSDKSYSPHPPNGSNSESEHEVRDRIRHKTAITPFRYPSMCAVSPETSDDDTVADEEKRKTVIPNVNVVIAEIHREQETNAKTDREQQVPKLKSSAINMYRCETPVPSNFSSSILASHPVGSSTPRPGISVTTFSPEINETINPNTKGSNVDTSTNTTVERKYNPTIPPIDKSLIPLKYAQRITVTPIVRNDLTGTIKRTPLKQSASNDTKTDKPSILSCIKNDSPPSYISFKAPDSPVSSLVHFKMGSEAKLTSPTGSLSRPNSSLTRHIASPTGSLTRPIASPTGSLSRAVARVTLDPTGNVVYASNSLERSRNNQTHQDTQSYATLPMYQNNAGAGSITPNGNQYSIERSVTPVMNQGTTRSSFTNRSTTPVMNRSTTPISSRSTTPVNDRSITPKNNRPTTTVMHRSTTPVNNRSTTPVNNMSNKLYNNRSTTPVNNRSTTPMNNRSSTPVNNTSATHNRSTTPINYISTIPVNNRSTNPINTRSMTPVNNNRSNTPIDNRSNTPMNYISTTSANNRSTTPITIRDVTPNRSTMSISNKSNTLVNNSHATPINVTSAIDNNRRMVANSHGSASIVSNRVPTSVDSTSSTNRPMSSRPTIPIVTKCTSRMQEVNSRDTPDALHNDAFENTLSEKSMQSLSEQKQFPQYQFSSFKSSNAGSDFNFRPSRGGRFCRSYFPSHLINTPSNGNVSPVTSSPSSSPASVRQSQVTCSSSPIHDYSVERNHPIANSHKTLIASQQSLGYVPNQSDNSDRQSSSAWSNQCQDQSPSNRSSPNSEWPSSNAQSGELSGATRPGSLSPPDLIPSGQSPSSTLDVTSSTRRSFTSIPEDRDKKNIKSLSATELFAIIHSSKKRHNIKSESELSMSPMSSRSVSPALSQSSFRLQPVETGVLTRRIENSPDRSKWSNSLPSSKKLQEKTTKQTSMHDFKMLLLQARTGSQDSCPRPSAAELLKVSPPKSSGTKLSSGSSYNNMVGTYSPGHGTVPLKRSMRTRSPYLTRYDSAYPPIIEDCSEEMESYEDNSKCLSSSNLPYKTVNNNNVNEPSSQASSKKATSTWV
ncbi:hypothetical protein JTE90_020496 [Oedothorax gibbosus]|uniref:Uncharacterized protein n=1 Tax=Oedothorax gibbosus TaxID=931172 RepID=A0AAV6UT45_9ARAC|nr:hypothetical protein JTE90_020496 [Oedothorax gibbosus]